MRRINIRLSDKFVTRSFYNEEELQDYLCDRTLIDFVSCDNTIVNDLIEVRDRIWNLNVAEPFQIQGYTFIIQSKARAGNVLMNGK